jgi:PTS system mannose-specific IIA component
VLKLNGWSLLRLGGVGAGLMTRSSGSSWRACAIRAEYLCRCDIIEAINRVDSGDGVAILTDMIGGTPSNLAISCMSRPKVEVLAGINLPMLVKLARVRQGRSLPEAVAMAEEAGRKYVTIASACLLPNR